jgi:acyl-CoA synthetase (AMP-forming)/AMP-acid ligase II
LHFASYAFDASILEILTTLIVGACVCVPDEASRLNEIAQVINDMNVDTAILTPSVAQMIKPSDVPELRTLILAGEAMSTANLSTWAGELDLVNGYGPSECSIVATAKAYMSLDSTPTTIGHSIDTCWIVDPNNHDRLAPIGAVGELLIEGPTLARGYLNNEQKTSESFIKNPVWTLSNANCFTVQPRRMYKTGDLVKYCPDDSGEMIYIGRKDNQVKIRGQRLELDEVEYHLRSDRATRHALVLIPKAGPCAKRLVAVLSLQGLPVEKLKSNHLEILASNAVSNISEIKENLRSHLPPYMIPSYWVPLFNLPISASGKLDRRQIEHFVETMSDSVYQQITASDVGDSENGLEASYVERRLRVICGLVLNLPPEGIAFNSSFLHLVSRVQK